MRRIAEVISREFNVNYNIHMESSEKYRLFSTDSGCSGHGEEYVEEWLEKIYIECVREANEKNATILFQDESGVQSRPKIRKTWSQKGKRSRIGKKKTGIAYQ